MRLRYPPGVSATANADLHFVGSSSGSTLNGEIIVTKLAMTPGFDFGAYLDRSQASALPPTNRMLNRIRLDIHIVTTPELQMQTASVRLSGDADLHLRGQPGSPHLGRADIIEGEVYFTAPSTAWSAATSLSSTRSQPRPFLTCKPPHGCATTTSHSISTAHRPAQRDLPFRAAAAHFRHHRTLWRLVRLRKNRRSSTSPSLPSTRRRPARSLAQR